MSGPQQHICGPECARQPKGGVQRRVLRDFAAWADTPQVTNAVDAYLARLDSAEGRSR